MDSSTNTLMSIADLERIGHGLVRLECVLATEAGDIYCSDWRWP